VIVGFPGETEEHFAALCQFVAEQKFDHLGVFTYSQEDDTPACLMPDQVPEEVKQDRYHQLMALQSKISEERNASLEGQVLDVLVEGINAGENGDIVFGRSYREAPDVDGRIFIENAQDTKAGDLVKVKIVQGFTYDLLAEKL